MMAGTYALPVARAAPAVVGVAAVGGYVGVLSWAMQHATYDAWGAMISLPLLLVVSVPLLRRAIRLESDRWFGRVLVAAFAVKLASGLVRYFFVTSVYGGVVDATSYSDYGQRISHLWLHGQFTFETDRSSIVGTGFMRLVTAAVYTVTGPSVISGYVVFGWLGFWGLFFAYRAFRIAMPNGDHHRYALLVFFLPSLVFWSSSIGKEAWMTLCVGVTALGAARIYARTRGGYPLLALGLLGGAMVRPHIVVFAVTGVLLGYILGPRRRPGPASAMWKVIGVTALSVAAFILLHRAAGFLGLTKISGDQIDTARTTVALRTAGGGSQFSPKAIHSPLDFPAGFVTVLFRPFPWEADNAQAIASSIESLLLLTLILVSWRRLKRIPALLVKQPYVTFAVVYIVLFVYAFSAFGNFGILVRERVQVLPFVIALAALPPRAQAKATVRQLRPAITFAPTRSVLR